MAALLQASPDFQAEHGYPIDAPGEANLTMASETFNCLALTLEMSFKDTVDSPMRYGMDKMDATMSMPYQRLARRMFSLGACWLSS